jgi:hypothetical protein
VVTIQPRPSSVGREPVTVAPFVVVPPPASADSSWLHGTVRVLLAPELATLRRTRFRTPGCPAGPDAPGAPAGPGIGGSAGTGCAAAPVGPGAPSLPAGPSWPRGTFTTVVPGLRLDATAPPSLMRQARVPSALATLLLRAASFLRDDDDTTTSADPLPLLHALADLQNLVNEAVHPALEDVTRSARRDMLLALYALGRPELRPLLPIRRHVVLPEPLPAVDAVATLERWPQVSAGFFGQLADAGERILLSVRFGGWAQAIDGERAADWARFWRAELHAYRLSCAIVS